MATPDELHLQLQWNHANEVHRLLDETFDLMDIEQRGLVGIKEGVPWVQAMGTRSADDVKLSKAMWTRRVTAIGCFNEESKICLLYTSDAADEEDSVDLGGCRIIKKTNKRYNNIFERL
eukprot:TRINITY_DN3694_c0_g1_i1.p2 TRINITY_DN3694_c0_g1~~TRINITY_DN3694_c0_g1_i1.p2  ORF type:complete len:119 (+),score=13.68 TRINITY_DN3694_c0_g1_i1:76-432(+)